MKNVSILLLLTLAIIATGCSKDAEVNAFIGELDATTAEIVSKIDADPTTAGIDDAQRAFDARKLESVSYLLAC